MEMQKEEAKILYDNCLNFLINNKDIYDETVNVIKYMNLLESAMMRIKKIDVNIYNYKQLLDNKYISNNIKKDIEQLNIEKIEINDDIEYYNKKINSMRSSEDIYMKYIYCQSDIRRYEKILLS